MKMKMAKVTIGGKGRAVIMPIDEKSFGAISPAIENMTVGEKRTFRLYDNDPDLWGRFGDFFDNPEDEMHIEIIATSEKEFFGLPEFDGF